MPSDQITKVISNDSAGNSSKSNPLNGQMVRLEAVQGRGDDAGLGGNRQAHAFHQDKQGYDAVTVMLQQCIQMM